VKKLGEALIPERYRQHSTEKETLNEAFNGEEMVHTVGGKCLNFEAFTKKEISGGSLQTGGGDFKNLPTYQARQPSPKRHLVWDSLGL